MIDNDLYIEDIKNVINTVKNFNLLKNKKILITGATGLIGTFLIDAIMFANRNDNLNCEVYAIARNEEKAKLRFDEIWDYDEFHFIQHDIKDRVDSNKLDRLDYIIHMASNTHPVAYSTDPIGTITTNVLGTLNLLELTTQFKDCRFVLASSNEIYGENRGDVELFKEDYCGYIDCNTLRAGYPESKRCSESLCQAYIAQKGIDAVIARLTRTYGATLLESDTKAMSQFLKKAINNENIVLKSEGKQFFSYTYVADAVAGLLTIMISGNCGEAYNIAWEESDVQLKDLANTIANSVGRSVVFELPDNLEKAGYSKATKARLDGKKLQDIGWKPYYSIPDGIKRTINILKKG